MKEKNPKQKTNNKDVAKAKRKTKSKHYNIRLKNERWIRQEEKQKKRDF